MAKYVNQGDIIIGKHIDGNTRRIDWKGLKRHPLTKQLMTLYECDLNSYAVIVKECTDDYSSAIETYYSHIGDKLEADAISIYVSSKKKEKFDVGNVSGRHKATVFGFRDTSISIIKTPLENLRKAIDYLKSHRSSIE